MQATGDERNGMRDRMLNDSLRALVQDSARLLQDHLDLGAEIPFEVGESGGRQRESGATALYAYKPLTTEFVSQHADELRRLPSFEKAAYHLARTHGTLAYLRVRDEPVLDVGELTHARLAVLAFLGAVWSDAEHFEPWEERFATAYSELESVALAKRLVTTAFIPVYGVALDCEVVSLGAGVELIGPEDLDADCGSRFSESAGSADCFCAVSIDAPSDAAMPLTAIRHSARATLTGLRMFKPGSVSLGLMAQADTAGTWSSVSMPFSGRAREEAWRLLPGEDEELRQFIAAVRRVERRTRVAWALKRFEMGLERTVPAEGLTDFLAAIRALLEAHDESGRAALPARVAALCARGSEREVVRASIEAAFALERLAIDGRIGRGDRKRLAKRTPLDVIAETERHLRALLHDLVCGYLATDLKKLADEILLDDGEPLPEDSQPPEPVYLEPVPASGDDRDPVSTREFDAVFDDTAEIAAVDLRESDVYDLGVREAGDSEAVDCDADEFAGDAGFRAAAIGDENTAEVIRFPDNQWTLSPASEVRSDGTPLDSEDPSDGGSERLDDVVGDSAGDGAIAAGDHLSAEDPGPGAWRLAHQLVSRFDRALSESMDEPSVATTIEPAPGDEEGFTFDFKVTEVGGESSRAGRVEAQTAGPNGTGAEPGVVPASECSDLEGDFPVPEFCLPIGRGPAAIESDVAVDGGHQRECLEQIMGEHAGPPQARDRRQTGTPAARSARLALVAIDGESSRDLLDEIARLDSTDAQTGFEDGFTEAATGAGVEVEAKAEIEPETKAKAEIETEAETEANSPSNKARGESPPALHAPLTGDGSRTYAIGPETVEFTPVVESDLDDPDDFAGIC